MFADDLRYSFVKHADDRQRRTAATAPIDRQRICAVSVERDHVPSTGES
jgi:hypothetical protein